MSADQDVVAVIETPAEKLDGRLGRINWSALAIYGLGLLITAFWVWSAYRDIAASWRDGQWDHHLWDNDFMQMLVTSMSGASIWFLALKFRVYYPSPRVTLNMAVALREAALARDDELAPVLTAHQDEPPSQVDPLPRRYGPFKRPQGMLAMMRGLLATLLALAGCLCVGGAAAVWLLTGHTSSRGSWTITLAVAGALSLLGAILAAGRAYSRSRPIEIAADDLGLTFTGRALRQPVQIPWGESRRSSPCGIRESSTIRRRRMSSWGASRRSDGS